jgi:hypothetical protein
MDSPERVIELVRELRSFAQDQVQVYWHTITKDRESFHNSLMALTKDDPILPVVLRGDGFTNANAILSDLNRLLEQQRGPLSDAKFVVLSPERPLVLVLLSRVELLVPQLCSPAILPSWLPCIGGLECSVRIQDLAKVADGRLNSPEASIPDLSNALFEWDKVIVRRLRNIFETNPRLSDSLRSIILKDDVSPSRFAKFLADADRFLGAIPNPEAYRPMHKDVGCVSAQMMQLFQKATPDELTQRAESLKSALGLPITPTMPVGEPLCSILFRPVNVETDVSRRVARAMIVTNYAACQFVTAAAHADAYPKVHLLLLRSQSYDLRRALTEFREWINRLD